MLLSARKNQTSRTRNQFQLERLEHRHLLAGDLVGHWSAEDLRGSFADGEEVNEWLDATNNIAANAFGSPKFDASVLGGRAAVRFNPADGDDYFRVLTSDNPIQQAGDFSVVVVFASVSDTLAGNDGPWFENSAIVDSSSLGLATDWVSPSIKLEP